ncbi:MAG: alpha/beta fold hydrolase [Pseudomonadota bacterium]
MGQFSRAVLWAMVLVASATLVHAQTFGKLQGAVWGSGGKATVVVLHGDVSGGDGKQPANYHYRLAADIAAQNGSATVVALLRPGYHDGQGRKSPGRREFDQYTRGNNNAVAQALQAIKKARPGAELIVVGHSGGAAQLGAIIGRFPGVVDAAVLMACPCHLDKWRQGRRKMQRGQSPHRFVGKVAKDTRVVAITGALDDNTTPALAQDYIARAKKAGLNADLILVDGAGHNSGSLYRAMYRVVKSEVRK